MTAEMVELRSQGLSYRAIAEQVGTSMHTVYRQLNPGWAGEQRQEVRVDRAHRRAVLDTVKRLRGCVDCGTTEGVLHFDHRPDEVKCFGLKHVERSWDALIAEMAKCDVRCARCHGRRHGVERVGSEVGTSKLTERAVAEIKRRLSEGELQKDLGRAFGVSTYAVRDIAQGRTWRHV